MSIVDWIYPRYCLGCRVEGQYFCPHCRQNIVHMGGSLRYTGLVRSALKAIKYRGTYDIVSELVDIWSPQCLPSYRDGVLTSVPMWQSKERLRGFNQADLLAREVARRWKMAYLPLLVRVRETRPMYGLTRPERAHNIHGAFATLRSTSLPVKVIVVDDVWTTGATLRECMAVLHVAGVRETLPLTLAR